MRGLGSKFVIVAATLAVVAAGCLPNPPPDAGPPANSPLVDTEDFVSGLDRPWDIAFLPDGTGLFTERAGRVSSFTPSGTVTVLGTIADTVQPPDAGESGLMGIAVDPDFATNHYIYVCVSSATTDKNEIRRYQIDPPTPGLSDETIMLTGMPRATFHDGCRVRFEPGSNPPALWITMGDAGIGTTPQDLSSLGGKILRTRVDDPSADPVLLPYDLNPFIASPNPTTRLIYTYGHRNPQGLAFQPGTNIPYSSEHGPSKNDEVNKLVPGGNGGWNPVPGYNQNVLMTDIYKYKDAMRPVWRSGQTFTVAPSGMTFIETVPGVMDWKGWDGALAVGFLKNMSVRIMTIDAQGGVSNVYRTLTELGSRLRSVVQGPDGALYIATDNGGPNDHIFRITPVP